MASENEYGAMLDQDSSTLTPAAAIVDQATQSAIASPSSTDQSASAPAPLAGYDQLLDEDKSAQRDSLKQSVYAAKDLNADRHAKVMALAKDMDLPIPIVDRNFEDLSKKRQSVTTDYDQLIDENPKLSKWLEDPNNVAVSKNDVGHLKGLEDQVNDVGFSKTLLDTIGNSLAGTGKMLSSIPGFAFDMAMLPNNIEAAKNTMLQKDFGANPADLAGQEEGVDAVGRPIINSGNTQQVKAPEWLSKNVGYTLSKYAQDQYQKELPQLGYNTWSDLKDMNFHRAASGLLIKSAAAAPDLIGALGFSLIHPALGAAFFGVSAGSTRAAELRDEGKEPAEAGLDTAAHSIVAAGAGEIGLLNVFKPWANSITNMYGKQVSQELFKDLFKTLAGTVAVESGTGATMSLADDMADYVTGINPNAMEGSFDRAANSAITQTFMGLGLAAPGGIAAGLSRQQQIHQTNTLRDFYRSFGNTAEATKLRQNLPEAQRQLVEQLTRDTPVENVYVSPDAIDTYFQSKGISPSAAMDELGALPAYGAAKEQGTDVKIPFASWQDKILGTEHYAGLANDVKFSPDGLSPNEAAAEQKRMQDEVEKAKAAAAPEAVDTAAQVGQTVGDQLRDLGLDPRQADIYESAFRTLGERSGIDPLELYNRFKLRVTGEQPTEDNVRVLNQKSPEEIQADVKKAFSAPDAMEKYNALPDSMGGRRVDTDIARNLFEPYAESREGAVRHADDTYEEASKFAKKVYAERLSKPAKPGEYVHILAGGSASGKTTYLDKYNRQVTDSHALVDTTSQNYESSKARIEQALESGRPVLMTYIFRDFGKALEGNAGRFKETGRLVQPDFMAKSHVGALDTFLRLQKEYKGNKDVSFEAFDNNGEEPVALPIAKLAKERYNNHGEDVESAAGRLQKIAEERLKNESAEVARSKSESGVQRRALGSGSGEDQGNASQSQGGDGERSEDGSGRSAGTDSGEPSTSEPGQSRTLKQSDDQAPRGQIHIGPDGINIQILKDADRSTFLHETGHFYLEVLKHLATGEDAPEQIKNDFATIQKWVGSENGDFTVEQHEQFARGFEAYLMEGKAPSEGLRKAFATFKVWLTSVYRSLKNLNVTLTPEVREVFDRIFATDEEIDRAQVKQNFKPLFEEPSIYGLSSEDFAKYQSAIDSAKLAANDELRTKVMADITREETKLYKEQRSAIRERVESEANQTRVFKARSLLQLDKLPDGSPRPEGTQKIKIDRASLVDHFGEEILSKLPRMYSREGGLDVGIVSDLLGYESPDQMVQELANSVPKDQFVDQQTDARMQDLHPDLLSTGTTPDEAVNAIYNDKQAKVLRMELNFLARDNMATLQGLIKRVAKKLPTDKQLRDQAEGAIGAQNVRELSPAQYRVAAARHAKEAGENLSRGDIDAAFESKRLELYNLELLRAANAARDDVRKTVRKFKDIASADEGKTRSRDADLVSTAKAVLAAFGIGRPDQPPATILERMKRYDTEGYAAAHNLVEMATAAGSGNYNEIPYNRFVDMKNAVDGIWDLAKSSKQIEIDGKKVSKDGVVDDLTARVADHLSDTNARPGYTKAITLWEKTNAVLLSAKAILRRTEHWVTAMDGGDKGTFRTHIWNPVVDAATKFRIAKQEMTEHYLKEVVQPAKEAFGKKIIDAPELGYQFKNKAELLGALLHVGNDSNLSKLLRGRRWGGVDENNNLDRTQWDRFVQRMWSDGTLTKADYDYVQGVWDMYEKLKPDSQRAHKRMYGYYFAELTATPFETPFGEYKGGYAPAIADPNLTEDAAIRLEKAALEQSGNSFMFPTAGRGFTKSRLEAYAAPLALDLGYVGMQIDKVLRFTYLEPSVRDVGRLVMDRRFRAKLAELDSSVAAEMLVPWLQRSVTQQTSSPSGTGKAWKAFDWMFKQARKNAGLNAMTLNVTNTLHQATGFSVAAVKVDPHYLRDALWSYMRNAKDVHEAMEEKSEYMRAKGLQMGELQNDINDIVLHPSKYDTTKAYLEKNAYILQRMAQGTIETVAWQGAYTKGVELGYDEKESVRYADSIVRQTQHSMMPEDVSRFGTGSPFMRLFTQFFDYYNMKANLDVSEAGNLIRESGIKKSIPSLVYLYTASRMIPAIMSASVMAVAGGALSKDDDHSYMNAFMHIFFGGQLNEALTVLPVVGPIINNQIARFEGKHYDERLQISPAIENLQRTLGAPAELKNVLEKNTHKGQAIRDAFGLIGMLTGVPLQTLAKPVGYMTDVQEGRVRPPSGPIDFARGLVTGQGKK